MAERECYPFLAFEVSALANMGPVIVRATGPPGAKEFLRTVLCRCCMRIVHLNSSTAPSDVLHSLGHWEVRAVLLRKHKS